MSVSYEPEYVRCSAFADYSSTRARRGSNHRLDVGDAIGWISVMLPSSNGNIVTSSRFPGQQIQSKPRTYRTYNIVICMKFMLQRLFCKPPRFHTGPTSAADRILACSYSEPNSHVLQSLDLVSWSGLCNIWSIVLQQQITNYSAELLAQFIGTIDRHT